CADSVKIFLAISLFICGLHISTLHRAINTPVALIGTGGGVTVNVNRRNPVPATSGSTSTQYPNPNDTPIVSMPHTIIPMVPTAPYGEVPLPANAMPMNPPPLPMGPPPPYHPKV